MNHAWVRYLWASPNTLLGLVAAALTRGTGGTVEVHSGVIEASGGFAAWFLRYGTLVKGGVGAMTLGHVVLGRDRRTQEACRVHERVHVEQYGRWGPFFLPAYALSSAIAVMRGQNAYHANRFERVAFRIETEWRESLRR